MKKGFAQIIIVVIIALLVAGVGFLMYKLINPCPFADCGMINNDLKDVTSSFKTPAANPEFTDETVHTDAGSANWKTYTDAVNKFTFKYPSDWDKLLVSQSSQNLLVVAPPENISKVSGSLANENPNLTIIIGKTDQKPNFETEIGWSVENKKEITLSGKPATRFTRIYASDKQKGFTLGAKTEWIVLQDGNSYYLIGLEDYKYLEIFNQILSTFKFTQ